MKHNRQKRYNAELNMHKRDFNIYIYRIETIVTSFTILTTYILQICLMALTSVPNKKLPNNGWG